ncbi:hypothetical protein [Pseudanabaena sp. ABRG5-3]|uniref:hypothetical protein n=1 Tax=Pseudanabaena sp. ABRG5-3 TaxID=685565 RepID=UPI000DC7107D|nr:hypothetical protein [Pseudanabaena sp. ABRG5-3]BBC26972.1 hypothetical protein ABRG53_d007 [Pseudanabaena sp. ABRG5-3]
MSENTTTTFADNDDLPDDIPLGNNSPLLVPQPLGQSFLQPKFIYPLGAVSIINPDNLSLETDFEPLSDSFDNSPFFDNPLQSHDSGAISPSSTQVNLQTKSLPSSQKSQVQRSPNPKTQSTSIQRKASAPNQPISSRNSSQSIATSENQESPQDVENDAQFLQNSSDLSISSDELELDFSENVSNIENKSVQRSSDNSSIGDVTKDFTDISLVENIDNSDLEIYQNNESNSQLIQKSADTSSFDSSTRDNTISEDRLSPNSENSSNLTTNTTSFIRDISTSDIQRESQSPNVVNSIENIKSREEVTNLDSNSSLIQRDIVNTVSENIRVSDNNQESQVVNNNFDSSSLISLSVDSSLQSEQFQPIQRTTNLSTDINASEGISSEIEHSTSSSSNLSSEKVDNSSSQSQEIQRQVDAYDQEKFSDRNDSITINSSYSNLVTNISEDNSLQISQENLYTTANSSIESIQRNLDVSNASLEDDLSQENNLTNLIQRQLDAPIVDSNSYQEDTLISNPNQTTLQISNHNQPSQSQNLQKQPDIYTSDPSLDNSISGNEPPSISNNSQLSNIDLVIQKKSDITVDNRNQVTSPIKSTQDDTNISAIEELSTSNEFLNDYTTQDLSSDLLINNVSINNASINTNNINQVQAKADLSTTVNNDISQDDLPSDHISGMQSIETPVTSDSNLITGLNTLQRSVISPSLESVNVQQNLVSEVSEDLSIKSDKLDANSISVNNIESLSQINDSPPPANLDPISEPEENNNSNYDITQNTLSNEYSLGVQRELSLSLSSSSGISSQNNLNKLITKDSSQIDINENLVDSKASPTIQTQLFQDNLSDTSRDNIEQSILSSETSNLEQPLTRNVTQRDINENLTDVVTSPVIQTYLDQDNLSNTTNINVDNIEQSNLYSETSDLQQLIEEDTLQLHTDENLLDVETSPTVQTQLDRDDLSNINRDNIEQSNLFTVTSSLDIQKKINLDNISSQNDLTQDGYDYTDRPVDNIHLQSTDNQGIQREANIETRTIVSSDLQNSNIQRDLNDSSQELKLDDLSDSFIPDEEINDNQLSEKSANSDRIDTFTNIQKQESQEFSNLVDTSISSDTISTSDTNDIQSDRLDNQIQRQIESSPNNLNTAQGFTDLSVDQNLSSPSQEIISTFNLIDISYVNSPEIEHLTEPSQLQRSSFNVDGISISDIETNIDDINVLSSSPEPEIQRSLETSTININNLDSSNIELNQEIPLHESSQTIDDLQSISTERNIEPNDLDNIDFDIQRQTDKYTPENYDLLTDNMSNNLNDSIVQLDSSQSVVENVITRQIGQEESDLSSNNILENETEEVLKASNIEESIQREIAVDANESNDLRNIEILDVQADMNSDTSQISSKVSDQVIQTSLDSINTNNGLISDLPEVSNNNSLTDNLDNSYAVHVQKQGVQKQSENITDLDNIPDPLIQREPDPPVNKSINTEDIISSQSPQIARDLSSEYNSSYTNLDAANDYLDAPLANENNSTSNLDEISNGSANNIQRQFANDSIADRVDIIDSSSMNSSYDLSSSLSVEDSNTLTSDRSRSLPVENIQSSIDSSTSNFNLGVDERQAIQRQINEDSISSSVDLNDSDRDLVDVQSAIDTFGINERISLANTSSTDPISDTSSNDNLNISTSRSNEIQREFDASVNEISNVNEISARDKISVENIDLANNSNVERSISNDINIQRSQLDSESFMNENANDIDSINIVSPTSNQQLVTTSDLPVIDSNISLSGESQILQRTFALNDTSIGLSNNISIQDDNQYDQQLRQSIDNINNTSILTSDLSPQLQRSSDQLEGNQLNGETNVDEILSQGKLAQTGQETQQISESVSELNQTSGEIQRKNEASIPNRSLDTRDLGDISLATVESPQNDLSVSFNDNQVSNFSSIENIDTVSPSVLQSKPNPVTDSQTSSNIISNDFQQDDPSQTIQRDSLNNSNLDDSNSVEIIQTNALLSDTDPQIIQTKSNLSQAINNIDNNVLGGSNDTIQAKYISTNLESIESIDSMDRNIDVNLDDNFDNNTANTSSDISVQRISNISEINPEASSQTTNQEFDHNLNISDVELNISDVENIQKKSDDINNIERISESNISSSPALIQTASDVDNVIQNIDDLDRLNNSNILDTNTNISRHSETENINNTSAVDNIDIHDIQRKPKQDAVDNTNIQDIQRKSEQDDHIIVAESFNTNNLQNVVDSDRISIIQPKSDIPQLETISQSGIISAETTNQLEATNEPTVIQRLSDLANPTEDLTLPTVLQNLGQTEPLVKFSSLTNEQPNHQITTNNLSNLSSNSNPSSQSNLSNSSRLSQLLQAKGNSSTLSSSTNKISTTPTSIQPKLDQNQNNDAQEAKSPSWSNIAELLAKMPPPKVSSNPSTNSLNKKAVSSSDRSSLASQPKSITTSTSKSTSNQTIIQRSPDDRNDDDLDLYITPTGLQRGNPNQVTNSQVNPIQRKKDPHQDNENLPEATVSVNNFQDNDNKDEANFEENLTALAQEIYVLLRQRLEIEKERQGSIYRGRLPW